MPISHNTQASAYPAAQEALAAIATLASADRSGRFLTAITWHDTAHARLTGDGVLTLHGPADATTTIEIHHDATSFIAHRPNTTPIVQPLAPWLAEALRRAEQLAGASTRTHAALEALETALFTLELPKAATARMQKLAQVLHATPALGDDSTMRAALAGHAQIRRASAPAETDTVLSFSMQVLGIRTTDQRPAHWCGCIAGHAERLFTAPTQRKHGSDLRIGPIFENARRALGLSRTAAHALFCPSETRIARQDAASIRPDEAATAVERATAGLSPWAALARS